MWLCKTTLFSTLSTFRVPPLEDALLQGFIKHQIQTEARSWPGFNRRRPISTISTFTHMIIPVTVVVVVNVYLTCTMSNKVHAVSIFAVISGATGHRVCDCEGDMLWCWSKDLAGLICCRMLQQTPLNWTNVNTAEQCLCITCVCVCTAG